MGVIAFNKEFGRHKAVSNATHFGALDIKLPDGLGFEPSTNGAARNSVLLEAKHWNREAVENILCS
jgi:hypothetical protein